MSRKAEVATCLIAAAVVATIILVGVISFPKHGPAAALLALLGLFGVESNLGTWLFTFLVLTVAFLVGFMVKGFSDD